MKRIFLVAALLIGSHLLAQQASVTTDSTTTLNEVIVSANKYPNKTSLTGKVVIVISRKDIERAGSKDLAQVINEQGGVYINGANSNPGKDKSVFIRGARVEHSLVTIDGVPVYDASGIGSNFDIRQIPLDNVERIEILKGSQSTLYGSDAIAGVIHIVTRKAGNKPFMLSGQASYGSYNSLRTNAAISGRVKEVEYNAGYGFFNTHGISEAIAPAGVTNRFDNDGYRQDNAQASMGFRLAEGIRINPYIRYSKIDGELDQQGFVDETDYTYMAKNTQAGFRNEVQMDKLKLNLLYNYNYIDRSFLDDSTGSRNGYYTFSHAQYTSNEHFADAFLVIPFHKLQLTTGVDFRSSNTDIRSLNVVPPFPPYTTEPFVEELKQSGDSVKQHQYGLYAALNWNAFPGLQMEAGGRFNTHSEYGDNLAYNFNPSYLLSERWKFFANISTGYKTPGLYQLFSVYGNRGLKPEESVNIEGGLQYFTKDGKASIRATVFNRKVKNVLAFVYNPSLFNFWYVNQDQQKDQGIELDGRIELNDKINIKVFYSYVNGDITTKQNGKDTVYNNLYRRPKSSLGFTINAAVKKFNLSASLNALGEAKDISFDPVTFEPLEINLKSYVLVNLYIDYSLVQDKLKFFADLRNVTDEQYAEILGYNAPGFNAYGGIRFRF